MAFCVMENSGLLTGLCLGQYVSIISRNIRNKIIFGVKSPIWVNWKRTPGVRFFTVPRTTKCDGISNWECERMILVFRPSNVPVSISSEQLEKICWMDGNAGGLDEQTTVRRLFNLYHNKNILELQRYAQSTWIYWYSDCFRVK